MKSISLTKLRSNVYVVVQQIELDGEEVILTSHGKAVAKVVPLDDDEGSIRPEFAAEMKRRVKEDKLIPGEKVFKELW